MGAFVQNIDRIREATSAHLMVVHHSGKDTAKGARGHSLLRAATDTEIEIADNQLKITKQRDMEMRQPANFSLITHELGSTKEGDKITSCTVSWGAAVISDFAEASDIGYREIALLEALKDSHAANPQSVWILRKSWYDLSHKTGIWPDNDKTAIRYMDKSATILIEQGYVCRGGRNLYKLLKSQEVDIFS